MKLAKDQHGKVIIALDSIRCDNRENKTISDLRQMDDHIMEYIERKGYCKYVLGEGNIFIRTLTDKGYDVLGSGTYDAYLQKQYKEKLRLLLPILISGLALVISVSTLLFGIYQFKKISKFNTAQLENTITHNKLSVKPILNIEKHISETFKTIGFSLLNKGIGPAIIVEQKLFYGGKQIKNWSELTQLLENDNLVFWNGNTPEWFDLDNPTISSKEELDLYHIDVTDLKDMTKAIQAFQKVSINYTYTNMYQDTFELSYPQ